MTFRIFSLKIFSHNLKNGNTTKNFSSNINVPNNNYYFKGISKKKCKFNLKSFNWVDLAQTLCRKYTTHYLHNLIY